MIKEGIVTARVLRRRRARADERRARGAARARPASRRACACVRVLTPRTPAPLAPAGKIVPASVTIELLKKAIASRPGPYLIDGFPRSMENAKSFEQELGIAKGVLYFEVDEATLEQRLLKRAETSGRSDDNAEVITKRFKTFQQTSLPVIAYLKTVTAVHTLDGAQPVRDVFAAVCKMLGHEVPANVDTGADAPTAD